MLQSIYFWKNTSACLLLLVVAAVAAAVKRRASIFPSTGNFSLKCNSIHITERKQREQRLFLSKKNARQRSTKVSSDSLIEREKGYAFATSATAQTHRDRMHEKGAWVKGFSITANTTFPSHPSFRTVVKTSSSSSHTQTFLEADQDSCLICNANSLKRRLALPTLSFAIPCYNMHFSLSRPCGRTVFRAYDSWQR